MKLDKKTLLTYAVTDRLWANDNLHNDVEKAILGGVTAIQLREKSLGFHDFLLQANKIKSVCNKYNIPFIINDNLDVMLACNADGIHIGQDDLHLDIIKDKVKNNKIIGVSVHTVEQAILAERGGASYLGVGAIFNTSDKIKSDAACVSITTLTDICRAVNIPVCAIGGISLDNIHLLKNTGIDGVSCVSAIFAQPNIEDATKILVRECEKYFI